MSIGAVGGIGSIGNDYSWYTPGSAGKVQEAASFDMALDAYDAVDDISDAADELANIAGVEALEMPNTERPTIAPIEETDHFASDRMGQDHSAAKVSMEDLYMSAIGFHTKRRIDLLGL
ncbi:MAG: hypothetical protein II842_13235 [Butyrivibrio sp.]|nr:hypothetical protein [Butyrivibrio sp.]